MLKVVPAAIYYRRLNRAGEAFFISDQVRTILGYGRKKLSTLRTFLSASTLRMSGYLRHKERLNRKTYKPVNL